MRKIPILILNVAALNMPALAQDLSLFDLDLEALMKIEVTVQRRSENILTVPIATTVMRDEALVTLYMAGEDMRGLTSRLPSLQVESSFGRTFPRFYVRGIGNTSFDLNASQPVSLLYDDVVLESPILKGLPIFDLAQLELARGPQGTLFGRNTPAGVIILNSVLPSETSSGFVRANIGRFQTSNIEAALGMGLGNGWSSRVSFLNQYRDDWVENLVTGPESGFEGFRDTALRWQLRYQSESGFEGLLKLHARDMHGTARLFRANIIEPGSNRFASNFDAKRVAQDGQNSQTLKHKGVSLRLRWPFEQFDLYSISAYETAEMFSRGDIDGGFGAASASAMGPGFIPFSSESAAALPRHDQVTQEIRLASTTEGPIDWQAGLFWFDESQKVENFNYDSLNNGVQNGYAAIRQTNQSSALFFAAGYTLNEHLQLRAGLRQTRDRKTFSAERPQSPGGGAPLMPLLASSDESHLSWDLSALWRLDQQHNLFIRVAEGFRAPSFQGRVMFRNTISQASSETVLSIETGLKAELPNRRLRYGITLYRFQLDDPQLTAVGGSDNVSQLINAEQAEGSGIEFEFDARLGNRWSLLGGLSYNHTAIKDPNLLLTVCGAPCSVTDPIVTINGVRLARVDGNPLPYAPNWIGQLQLRYEAPVATGRMYFHTDWTLRSSMNFFLYESSEFRASSLVEGGMRLGYTWQNSRYNAALFVRNLTDKTALIGAIDFNNLTGMINEPRIWGVEFTASF